ncbi:hypothetical protein [uncultured Psychroserpens sp.]|uniref:DUF7670 domain-containing protein n=1 Tax=uncultured Psychroserpens sp. TaxID=255436 RepID=UPI002629E0FB|nr:hypothetical protein [uncultured Psychroserpens sp.]
MLRYIARYGLLLIASLLLAFSILSGSTDYGGGIEGVLRNSPNGLPWILLIVLVFVARKRELFGGILIIISGLWLVYFFNFRGPNFWWIILGLTSLIPLLGSLFVISWYLRSQRKNL